MLASTVAISCRVSLLARLQFVGRSVAFTQLQLAIEQGPDVFDLVLGENGRFVLAERRLEVDQNAPG